MKVGCHIEVDVAAGLRMLQVQQAYWLAYWYAYESILKFDESVPTILTIVVSLGFAGRKGIGKLELPE